MALLSSKYVSVDSSDSLPDPIAPWEMVQSRFDETLDFAGDMVTLLTGADGESGYLGELREAITSAPTASITAQEITSSITIQEIGDAPLFDDDDLTDYPDEEYSAPSLVSIPTIDTSELTTDTAPAEVNPTISWSESELSTDVYTDLLERLLADLEDGATGLSTEVQALNAENARTRQIAANDRAREVIENDVSGRDFSTPSGALNSAIADHAADALVKETEVNNQILIEQGKLAAENSIRTKELAIRLEELIRTTKAATDQITLDKAKSDAQLVLQIYVEKVRAFVAKMEQKKLYIEAQVENLRGAIETNKGNIEIYKEQYQAYAVKIEATSAKNKGFIDVFLGRTSAFSEKASAIKSKAEAQQAQIAAEVAEAEFDLRAQIETARIALEGYVAEGDLTSKVSEALANIANQGIASSYGAVNASASLGYTGHESKSESWGHNEGLSEGHSYQEVVDAS